MTQTGFFRIALVMGFLLIGLSYQSADAKARLISLHQSPEEISQINISKGQAVKVSNDFKTTLYHLKIVKVSTGIKMMQIEEFQSGQAFDLEFVREGIYAICYSLLPKSESTKNTCHQVVVEARLKA